MEVKLANGILLPLNILFIFTGFPALAQKVSVYWMYNLNKLLQIQAVIFWLKSAGMMNKSISSIMELAVMTPG